MCVSVSKSRDQIHMGCAALPLWDAVVIKSLLQWNAVILTGKAPVGRKSCGWILLPMTYSQCDGSLYDVVKTWNSTEDQYSVFSTTPLPPIDPSDTNGIQQIWHGMAHGRICLFSSGSVSYCVWTPPPPPFPLYAQHSRSETVYPTSCMLDY